jgi:hypothetical protein
MNLSLIDLFGRHPSPKKIALLHLVQFSLPDKLPDIGNDKSAPESKEPRNRLD